MTTVAHVGIAVPALDRAAAWYGDVLGFQALGAPSHVEPFDGHAGTVAADVLGASAGSFRQAQLTSANGVALELFEFEQGAPWSGIFHLCLTAPDLRRTAEEIACSGGRRRSRVWEIFHGEPYLTCYCEDPFGNIVELYSHSPERTYANR